MRSLVRRPGSSLLRTLVAIACFGGTLATSLSAQQSAVAATVRGQVRSATGAPVPRATVELLNAGGRAERLARADDDGRYSLPLAAVGRIQLRATSIGYLPSVMTVDVVNGTDPSVNFVLTAVPSALAQVVISANRTGQELAKVPASVSLVSQEVIQGVGRRNTSIEEALRTVPGLVVRDQLGGASRATIAIRGAGSSNSFGVRSIRLMIDGIPKNNAGGSGQDLANLDMSSISGIEVLRGPASTLYGNQAGGVVSMTSETGGPDRRQLQVLAGSFGFARVHAKATGEAFDGNVSYLVSAWRTQQDGYRDNSNFDQTGFSSKFVYRPDAKSTVTGVMSYDNLGQDVPGGLTIDEMRATPRIADSTSFTRVGGVRLNNFGRFDEFRFGLNVARSLSETEQIETQIFYVPRAIHEAPALTQFLQQSFLNRGITMRLLSTRRLGSIGSRFTTGVDLHDTPIQTTTTGRPGTAAAGTAISAFDEQATSVGVYVLEELELGPAVTLTAGARYDNIRFKQQNKMRAAQTEPRTFTRVTPKLGLTYRISQTLSAYANFSESFESPVIGQLRNSPRTDGEFVTNQVVKPLSIRTFEVGTRGVVGRGSFELAVFSQRVSDQAVNVNFVRPAPATGQFGALVNAAEVKQQGIEAGAKYALTGSLSLAGTYTYSDFTYARYEAGANDFGGNELPGIPKHNGFLELRYQGARGLSGGVEVQSVGKFFLNDANTAENPAYRLVNLRAAWTRRVGRTDVAPFVAVNNLFSEKYSSQPQINAGAGRFFNPLPGVNYVAGIRLNW
ncbi:TonB-dependent receptor [Gemmatimonas sp. UBA7669]|uniref:TonB-dependent receptor n=1 Tax=Gemmatimonas sp. UBA7669 TaxID=1946568 RepID=UPI0025C2DD21|nr:TonB-dependent receptor [Gemmatimonas sp. UBA7669]